MSNVLEAHNKHQNKTTDAFLFSLILDFLVLKERKTILLDSFFNEVDRFIDVYITH